MISRPRAESGLSLLIALSLFSSLFLSISTWQSAQTAQRQLQFQRQQALLIADNQIDRLLAGQACETQLQQNGIRFDIHPCHPQHIRIAFPLGEVVITPTTR